MSGEQVRWGLENLALDQKKLDAGLRRRDAPGIDPCVDHMGPLGPRPHLGRRKWKFTSDWLQADEKILRPMVRLRPTSTRTRRS